MCFFGSSPVSKINLRNFGFISSCLMMNFLRFSNYDLFTSSVILLQMFSWISFKSFTFRPLGPFAFFPYNFISWLPFILLWSSHRFTTYSFSTALVVAKRFKHTHTGHDVFLVLLIKLSSHVTIFRPHQFDVHGQISFTSSLGLPVFFDGVILCFMALQIFFHQKQPLAIERRFSVLYPSTGMLCIIFE